MQMYKLKNIICNDVNKCYDYGQLIKTLNYYYKECFRIKKKLLVKRERCKYVKRK